ncbi:unnamed protein product [Blepharisma stoltei]|uniref:Protein kinase domain-containing protein n=1 Tax=Blepharisma stoltei TaxID=1481888 RepID=A0AAU9JIB7_9CILI|nr:unnamed protein product [Blepharisma stoltei]
MGDLYQTLSELLSENPAFRDIPDISKSQGKSYDSLSKKISEYLKNFCQLIRNNGDPDAINQLFRSLTIPILACTDIQVLLELFESLRENPDAFIEKFYIKSRCYVLINTIPKETNFESYLMSSVNYILKMRQNEFDTRGTEMIFANYCLKYMEENLNNKTSHKLAKKIEDIIDPMDFRRFKKLKEDLANSNINKELNRQDFRFLEEIYSNNKGNFSIKVHKGMWRNPRNEEVEVAIKVYKFSSKTEKNERYTKMIETESDILQKINAYDNKHYDNHFVKYYGYVKIDEEPFAEYWVVMELYEETLIEYARKNVPSDKKVLEFAKQLLEGLAILHEKNIAHLDIKPQNIFVQKRKGKREGEEEISLKIADFNISLDLGKNQGRLYPVQGTPGFMAPELEEAYERSKASNDPLKKAIIYDPKKADMFSLGLTLGQCLRGKGIGNGFSWDTSQRELSDFINRYKKSKLGAVLEYTLKREPNQRLDADRIIRKLNGEEDEEEKKIELEE